MTGAAYLANDHASKNDMVNAYISSLPARLKGYAGAYWRHLSAGTAQPNLDDFADVTFAEAQAVRIKLAVPPRRPK